VSLFDLFRRKATANEVIAAVDGVVQARLLSYTMAMVKEDDGRTRVEDAVSLAAITVAERCLDAAGDFDLRDHSLTPGARVFSDRVNVLLCGDIVSANLDDFPAESIVGVLRDRLDWQKYQRTEFPALVDVFKYYAAHIGEPRDWGTVPLSIPAEHWPRALPLRDGYETRPSVDEILKHLQGDKLRGLRVATEVLAEVLNMVADAIDHRIVLTLALEMINGMAKTAPMTAKALAQARTQPPPAQ